MNDTKLPDAETKAANDRARLIDGLRKFADWLEANPWAPVARTSGYLANAKFQVDLHGPGPIGADADLATVERVRGIAARLGVKAVEMHDRTDASIEIGSVAYSVIAWHKAGRPDERDAELARLRAEVAALRSARPMTPPTQAKIDVAKFVGGLAGAAAQAYEDEGDDPSGLTYSREDDDPQVVRPHSPRVPLHVAGMVAGGELVDEAGTLSAAIYFSNVQREVAREAGRISPERLRAATLDLLHEQARAEDAERAQRADVREGEQGRITNPGLAHFLAKTEESQRAARHFLGLEESAKHYPVDGTAADRHKDVRTTQQYIANAAPVSEPR